jgi:hypothetical protein
MWAISAVDPFWMPNMMHGDAPNVASSVMSGDFTGWITPISPCATIKRVMAIHPCVSISLSPRGCDELARIRKAKAAPHVLAARAKRATLSGSRLGT